MTVTIHQFKNEEEWLAARRGYICGSDVPLLCGRNPYVKPTENALAALWREKTGGEGKDLDSSAGFGKRPIYWGGRLQRMLLDEFNSLDPLALYKPCEFLIVTNDRFPWLAASPDGRGFYDDVRSICEVKSVSEFLRPKFINPDGYTAPELYTYQLFTLMLVAEVPHGVLLPFIGGNTLAPSYYSNMEGSEQFEEIIETTREFHESFILTNTEPPSDWRLNRV